MVTISDVAKEAGVSLSTVSRTLNNSQLVSPEKKRRVMDAVERLGYKPLRTTAARKTGQSKIIVLATLMLEPDMLDRIRQEAEGIGCQMVISYIGEASEGYAGTLELLKMLPRELLCGVIYLHNDCLDGDVWEELAQYPNVQIGEFKPSKPLNCIMIDDREATRELTSYLLEQGHRRIAYVSSPKNRNFRFMTQRMKGFKDALQDYGLEPDKKLIFKSDRTVEGGTDIARQLMELPELPDAVFCGSDQVAVGCLTELQSKGFKVPDDIAVCGFDNLEISESCNPSITTIAQPFDEMGCEAVHILDTLNSGTALAGRKLFAPHSLVRRGSA